MALYDLAAVLLPFGPLKLLVELAITRDEDIPALVYEARPVTYDDSAPRDSVAQRRVWRERRDEPSNFESNSNLNVDSALGDNLNSVSESNLNENTVPVSNPNPSTFQSSRNDTSLVRAEEGRVQDADAELSAPLINHRMNVQGQVHAVSNESLMLEGIGLGSSGAIKLGLGDFIFYSVLVGRAAMYDFMTVYACYLAIVAGLGITLMLLALYQKALPALPVSVAGSVALFLDTVLT